MSDYTKDAELIATQVSGCAGGGCENCVSRIEGILQEQFKRGRREENEGCAKIRRPTTPDWKDAWDCYQEKIRARLEAI